MIIPQTQVVLICQYEILSIIANVRDTDAYDIDENYMDTNIDVNIDINIE